MLGLAAPVVAAGACTEADTGAAARATVVAEAPPVSDAAAQPVDKELGRFHLTFYYVIGEDEALAVSRRQAAKAAAEAERDGVATAANESVLAAAIDPEPAHVTLYNGRDCSPIAEVTQEFADAVELQGTGKLRDGRVINVSSRCGCGGTRKMCYVVTGRKWGTAGTGRALDPFRTVAVDPKQVKLGSLLYIPALDGLTMPGRAPTGGWKHDGCVVADDTGGGIDGKQLDLFVARRAYYLGLARKGGSHGWSKHVRVLDGASRCIRQGGRVYRVGGASI